MRWEDLFADLEGQFALQEAVELAGEVADRTRREWALLTVPERARPGSVVTVSAAGLPAVAGRVQDVGVDWLLLEEQGRRELLISTANVLTIAGLDGGTETIEGEVRRKLDLRFALRGLARDRAGVQVVLVDGSTRAGTIDRVGADHLELAEHAAGEPRRRGSVTAVVLIPLTAISAVRGG
jgi:hypothetical protein